MKQGWERKSLGEIADVEYGFTDKSTEEGNYRYVRITDIDSNGELISTDKKYLKHSKEAEGFLIHDNDLLMARTGATFAKVLLYEDIEPSVFASYLIRIKFKEKIENKLYWYFTKTKSYWVQANSLASGAAQPHFNGAAVKQVIFSYPKSLPEQQRIVAILDEAFAAIAKAKANAQQNLQNAKEFFESYLQGVFENKGEGWEEKTIKELTTVLGDGLHGTPKYTIEGEYHFINGNNLSDGVIELKENTKRVSIEEYNKYKKNLTDRTVLVSINGTLGNVAFYNGEKIILGKSACFFNLKESVDKDFVKYVLTSPYFLKYAHQEATGATIKNVSLKTMREFIVPLPLLKTQQTIVQKLDALHAETKKLEAIYQQKLNDLEELKKSILQKAFAGELKTEKSRRDDKIIEKKIEQ